MNNRIKAIFVSITGPFKYFGSGLWRILKRVFSPSIKGRLRWRIVAIVILALAAGLYDHSKPYNDAAKQVNNRTASVSFLKWVKFPEAPNVSWKLGLDLLGGTQLLYEADMSGIAESERPDALAGVRDVIERRVNAFGVSEPLVQTNRTGSHYRIIIELAGVKDVNQAIQMIGETPTLDFREVAEGATPSTVLAEPVESAADIEEYNKNAKIMADDVLKQALSPGADFAALAKKYSEDGSKDNGGDIDFFSKGMMVEPFETAVWNMKNGQITKELVQTAYGYHIIKKTDERIVDGEKQVRASHILIGTKNVSDTSGGQVDGWIMTTLSGKHLKKAQVVFDPNTGEPTVQLTWNSEGDQLFSDLTEKNVGKQLGIFLDGQPISAPTVQQKITGGTAIISGNFSLDEAKTLSRRLNAGALPVPVTLMSQQTVDATLGSASLQKSLFAGFIGFALVALFMLLVYRLPGFMATLALIVYTALTLAVFKLFNVTMTLAGIAGFILSIGMAVDANVLIFERVKEELRAGRTIGDALNEGFKRAWNSIRDSNVSSLITCAILIWFGTSTVRGFAITLAIGILISMFSAISVTRNFLRGSIGRRIERHLWLIGSRLKKKETA